MRIYSQIAVAFLMLGMLYPALIRAQGATAGAIENVPAASASSAVGGNVAAPLTQYQLPPAKLKQSAALYHTRMVTYILSTIYGIVLLVLLLNLKVAARFRDIAEKTSSRRFVQVLVVAPLLLITIDVLTLPISLYRHHLSMSYALSVQSWGSWLVDWLKSELITIVIMTLIVSGLYAILRRSPQRWWLYAWLATIPVMLLIVFIQPVFIDPMFNRFEPLERTQPALLIELEKVMHRGGLEIDRSRMLEMRASDKVTTYNAYVTGIGASKRVVVWDNTARDMTIPETMFIFGHEQGHYVLHHIWKGLLLAIIGFAAAYFVAYRLIGSLVVRWGARWDIRSPSDWASLPAFLLIFTVSSTLAQPVVSGVSRYMEHQADVYGLEVIHGLVPDSTAVATQAFQKLGEKGLAYPQPDPFYVWWAFSHPATGDRLAFAARYQPWNQGQPTQFIR